MVLLGGSIFTYRVRVKGDTAVYIALQEEGGDGKTPLEVDSDSKVKVSWSRDHVITLFHAHAHRHKISLRTQRIS